MKQLHARIIARHGLAAINSATKYPSIPTYHKMGDKGRLTQELEVDFASSDIFCTEKIDGTNARIVLFPDGSYLIGSREEVLYASGDMLHIPTQGIVETIRSSGIASALSGEMLGHLLGLRSIQTDPSTEDAFHRGAMVVVYGEVYGGKASAASKHYTGGNTEFVGFRVFDAWSCDVESRERLLEMPREEIACWRESNAQGWWGEDRLRHAFGSLLVPRILPTKPLPIDLHGAFGWLRENMPKSSVTLSGTADGKPEGIVVRTYSRRGISKLRFEDYEKTLKR